MLAWESFGEGWVTDVVKQLKLDAEVRTADYGELADLGGIDPASDVVFTWNGTTSGVRVPDGDWIADDRDRPHHLRRDLGGVRPATSTGTKIDVGTFSWQKALGGEGGARHARPRPARGRAAGKLHARPRPLPKIFRLTKGGKLIEGIFKGETINTPSMLAVEDWLVALDWAERIGGLDALIARADANAAALDRWVAAAGLDRASRRRSRRSARTPRSACNSPTAPTTRPTRRGRRRS